MRTLALCCLLAVSTLVQALCQISSSVQIPLPSDVVQRSTSAATPSVYTDGFNASS